jgi:hypothetical protein
MLKFCGLSLTLTIALLPMTPAWSLSAPTDGPCYMQTASGQLISLDQLCKSELPKSTAAANPKMVVDRVDYDGQRLEGVVTNQTGEAVSKVTINYTLVDAQGKELDSGMITQRVALAPGESLPFAQTSSYPGATVQISAIDWTL